MRIYDNKANAGLVTNVAILRPRESDISEERLG
jgi:hypothetical protein